MPRFANVCPRAVAGALVPLGAILALAGPPAPRQLDLAERLKLDAVLHLALGLGPDDDAALGRELLQPRGDVRGIAECVVPSVALVGVGEHDGSRVQRPRTRRSMP